MAQASTPAWAWGVPVGWCGYCSQRGGAQFSVAWRGAEQVSAIENLAEVFDFGTEADLNLPDFVYKFTP